MTGFARFNQRPPKDPNAVNSPKENVAPPIGEGFDELGALGEFGIDQAMLTNNDFGAMDDGTNGEFGFLGGDFGGIDDTQEEDFNDYNVDFEEMESAEPVRTDGRVFVSISFICHLSFIISLERRDPRLTDCYISYLRENSILRINTIK